MEKRKYTLKRRAEQQRETRERIVDAAMALHEELGPAETTISAVADRADVQRLTVYRHFANDRELFGACTSKWLNDHPPPDAPAAAPGGEPAKSTHATLLAVYRYYRNTERMWTVVYRDLAKVPAMAEPMAAFERHLDGIGKRLLSAWSPRRSKRLIATLRHALRFATWQSLADQGLDDTAIADLVGDWVRAAARA
jgi:AcrR family transcriptional regulator